MVLATAIAKLENKHVDMEQTLCKNLHKEVETAKVTYEKEKVNNLTTPKKLADLKGDFDESALLEEKECNLTKKKDKKWCLTWSTRMTAVCTL